MTPNFYRAFEEKYRGPRELIKGRLQVYHPFIQPLAELDSDCTAVDLGCGRGEWLEVLQEWGLKAHGVDLDQRMLEAARELKLSVEKCDAVAYLEGLPDESQHIISGFHIAEHLAFEELQLLVREALRVLKPAGLLILETPNPENLRVATVTFYLDPTHKRPIPPELLLFLPEHYGFFRSKLLRLQESQELAEAQSPELLSVLNGASPDYAVVAQKDATPDMLARFDGAFIRDYGLRMEELAKRYEAKMQDKFSVINKIAQRDQTISNLNQIVSDRDKHIKNINNLISERDEEISKLNKRIAEYLSTLSLINQAMDEPLNEIRELQREVRERDAIISDLSQTTAEQTATLKQAVAEGEEQINGLNQRLVERHGEIASLTQAVTEKEERLTSLNLSLAYRDEQIASLNQAVADRDGQIASLSQALTQSKEENQALLQSRSWVITRPLRLFFHFLRRIKNFFKAVLKGMVKPFLARAISFAQGRPALKVRLVSFVRRYPNLELRLRRFAAARGLVQQHSEEPEIAILAPQVQEHLAQPEIAISAPQVKTNPYPEEYFRLTPHARKIYDDLEAAIEAARRMDGGR